MKLGGPVLTAGLSLAHSTIAALRGKSYLDMFAGLSHVEGFKGSGKNPLKITAGALRHVLRGAERFAVKKIIGFGETRRTNDLVMIAKSNDRVRNKSDRQKVKLIKAGLKFTMEHDVLTKKGAYFSAKEKKYKENHAADIMNGVEKVIESITDQKARESLVTKAEISIKLSPGKYWLSAAAIAGIGFIKAVGIKQVASIIEGLAAPAAMKIKFHPLKNVY